MNSSTRCSRSKRIRETIINYMTSSNKWADEMSDEIPVSYEKYGEHLLFSEPAFAHENWKDAGENLWLLICDLYGGKQVVVKSRIQDDDYRSPQVRLMFGDSTVVKYTDNGIKYTWDFTKSMFSAGNVTERHRIAKMNCDGEVIVDLFAGIGYFTLPYLVHAKANFVHSCEWNKYAVLSLRNNLKLNGVADRCKIYEGDNRKEAPKNIANRVNVGLIPSSEQYWSVACESLLDSGGTIYIHQNVTSKKNKTISCDICKNVMSSFNIEYNNRCHKSYECHVINNDPVWCSSELILKFKHVEWFMFGVHVTHCIASILSGLHGGVMKARVVDIFKVKSYAPHIDHMVFTVFCFR